MSVAKVKIEGDKFRFFTPVLKSPKMKLLNVMTREGEILKDYSLAVSSFNLEQVINARKDIVKHCGYDIF